MRTPRAATLSALRAYRLTDDLFIDFTVATSQGCERIARLAFDYARKTGKNRVSCVTKANIIKTTDGKFLDTCQKVAKEYPEVQFDDWYIDIMTAKLLDDKRRRDFKVVVLPNLYGDIITDEAAEIQGGVGTAGSCQYRQALCDVRGNSRLCAAYGTGRPRKVRGSVLRTACSRYAA